MPDKISIRNQVLEKRNFLAPDILDNARKAAANKLMLMEEYLHANTVMAYMDFRNEVPTGAIIEQIRRDGKKLILPFTNKDFSLTPYEIPGEGALADYLITSGYGILEPNLDLCKKADADSIDLIIIPGSAFDQYENRMGYGKGCYDKFLASLPSKPFKLALAYDFQVLPCIPADITDVKMDKILTIGTGFHG